MSLGHGLEVWCGSLAPGSFLYLQNQQWWFESLLYHVTPTYIRPPSSTFKGPCDFIRLTQIIQDNLYQDFCGHCACCPLFWCFSQRKSSHMMCWGPREDGTVSGRWVLVSVSRADWLAWPRGLGAWPPPTMAQTPAMTTILESFAQIFFLFLTSHACQALIIPCLDVYNLVPPEFLCRLHLSLWMSLTDFSKMQSLLKISPCLPKKCIYLNLTSRSFHCSRELPSASTPSLPAPAAHSPFSR